MFYRIKYVRVRQLIGFEDTHYIYLQRCSNNAKEASANFPSKHVIISVDVLVGSQMELFLSIKFNLLNKERYTLYFSRQPDAMTIFMFNR